MRSLDEIMEHGRASLADGPQKLPRRNVSAQFTEDDVALTCFRSPETDEFEPFELEVSELSAGEELAAAKRAKGNANVMGFEYAKAAISGFNGSPVTTPQREWLWSRLSLRGRNKVLVMLGTFTKGMDDDGGKAED